MSESKKENLEQWVNTWEKAGKALEEIKQQKLKNPNTAFEKQTFDSMINWACQNALPRKTSGLVEQQRYFTMLKNTK